MDIHAHYPRLLVLTLDLKQLLVSIASGPYKVHIAVVMGRKGRRAGIAGAMEE